MRTPRVPELPEGLLPGASRLDAWVEEEPSPSLGSSARASEALAALRDLEEAEWREQAEVETLQDAQADAAFDGFRTPTPSPESDGYRCRLVEA
eukprot:2079816-Alexandrium_andersonii.AAC.1